MIVLHDGPADGWRIPRPRDYWVWVAIVGGELVVFDLTNPAARDDLDLVGRGGWDEYVQDPHDADVYSWSRRQDVPT